MSDGNVHTTISLLPGFKISRHAWERMSARGLSPRAINAALQYGRIVHTRGAEVYAIGHKEVQRFLKEDADLRKYAGVQVVCNQDGTVMTVYRNNDFRGLHTRGGKQRWIPSKVA